MMLQGVLGSIRGSRSGSATSRAGRSSGTARMSEEEFPSFRGHVAERGAEGIDPGTPVHVILDVVVSLPTSHPTARPRRAIG